MLPTPFLLLRRRDGHLPGTTQHNVTQHNAQVLHDACLLQEGFFYDKDAVLIDTLVNSEVRATATTMTTAATEEK